MIPFCKHIFTQAYGYVQIKQANFNPLHADGDISNSPLIVDKSQLAQHANHNLQQTKEIFHKTWKQSTHESDPS